MHTSWTTVVKQQRIQPAAGRLLYTHQGPQQLKVLAAAVIVVRGSNRLKLSVPCQSTVYTGNEKTCACLAECCQHSSSVLSLVVMHTSKCIGAVKPEKPDSRIQQLSPPINYAGSRRIKHPRSSAMSTNWAAATSYSAPACWPCYRQAGPLLRIRRMQTSYGDRGSEMSSPSTLPSATANLQSPSQHTSATTKHAHNAATSSPTTAAVASGPLTASRGLGSTAHMPNRYSAGTAATQLLCTPCKVGPIPDCAAPSAYTAECAAGMQEGGRAARQVCRHPGGPDP